MGFKSDEQRRAAFARMNKGKTPPGVHELTHRKPKRARKKRGPWTKLYGAMFLNMETGDVVMRYGEDG